MEIRDLKSVDDFRRIVELERVIWGCSYEDVVPVAIFVISVKRGGILLGAFDGDELVGFVYSLPGFKNGQCVQWSHMLGVVDAFRGSGLGRRLKLEQRTRALAQGIDLIEWTFDPLQAQNAHLNLASLGAVVEEYAENVYGESTSPLHGRTPTDRFVASWYIRTPHVERRVERADALPARAREVEDAPLVNRAEIDGAWLHPPERIDLEREDRRLRVEIPTGFTEMLGREPERAHAWRMATRRVFSTYLGRGYRVVDFELAREARRGRYLLARSDT